MLLTMGRTRMAIPLRSIGTGEPGRVTGGKGSKGLIDQLTGGRTEV